MKKSINVYVLKEYRDDYAYGEELIRVYSRKKDALSRLRNDVEDWAKTDWDNVYCKMEMDDGDTFEPDYVSCTNNGVTCFFIIEKHEMELSYEMMKNIADEVEHADNIEDACSLNDERDNSDKLSDDELNVAVERYEDGRDWNFPYAEQLASYMDSVVAERNLASNSVIPAKGTAH